MHTGGLRRTRHLSGLVSSTPQRPLTVDVLSGRNRGQDKVAVIGHARRHGHDIDLRIGDKREPVPIGLRHMEGVRRLLSGLLAAGGHSGEGETLQSLNRRHVRITRPTAFGVRTDDPDTQIRRHTRSPRTILRRIISRSDLFGATTATILTRGTGPETESWQC